jgi:hypothetical protein
MGRDLSVLEGARRLGDPSQAAARSEDSTNRGAYAATLNIALLCSQEAPAIALEANRVWDTGDSPGK